ncbi:MAG: LysR family transcriptional regulator [Verrucomicrobia bacterium]|nr:LysR family transcriptional regulator [Verrucomicrobiota bacterium]
MELRQLLAFKRIAELRSYTRAAESLSLTQPAISHQLRLLEEDMGQKLLEMNGRMATLTLAGETFLPFVERILEAIEGSKRAMETINTGERGSLTIAAIGSSTVYVLPHLLYKFRVAHPQIDIILRTAGGDEIRDLVAHNQVDIGIVGSHVPISEFATLPLFKDKIVPFVNAGHPLARKRRVTFAEIAREPLIQLGTWRSWRNYVLSIFHQVGATPSIRLQLDSIDAVKRMVERGLGFTIIPHTAAREEVAEGKLAALNPIDVPPLTREVLMIRRKQKTFSRSQQLFIDFLQAEIPKLKL